MQQRFKNFFLARQRQEEDCPWVRVEELEVLELKHPVVMVNGCFDILHSSHMRMLFAAREKAKTLICALDSDRLVREKKGHGRPIMTWIERATSLGYMPVDYIVEIDGKEDLSRLIRAVRPDLRVQGWDHQGEKSRFRIPKMFIREGKIHTSEIIERIGKRYGKDE